ELRGFRAVRESHGEYSPVLDVYRIGLDKELLSIREAGCDIPDISSHSRDRYAFAARLCLHLFEIEYCRKWMTSHADQRAAAGHRPLCGMSGMRAAVALFSFHEKDFVFRGVEYLDYFRHCRRVDPVFCVHEQPAAGFDGGAGLVHFLHDALVHERLRHVLADRALVAIAPEIA